MPDCVSCDCERNKKVKMKPNKLGLWECSVCGYYTTFSDEELLEDMYNEFR